MAQTMKTSMKTAAITLTLVSALALGACGGGGDDVSAEQAAAITSATSSALTSAQSNIAAGLSGKHNGWINADGAGFTVNGTVQNPAGSGSATIVGSGSLTKQTGAQAELTITFNNWTSPEGYVLNGAASASLGITKLLPLDAQASAGGSLSLSHASTPLVLTVDFDLQSAYQGGVFSFCGNVGNQPVGSGPCQ